MSKSTSSKKLASGYRINTAADDAAKLSISEKMRAQIRGLDQASNNIQDSISLLQAADGVLENVSSIMQRIRELSVQAANDIYTDQDRAQIQQECDQLQEEMHAVFDQTAFHSIPIFSGLAPDSIISDGEISNDLLQKGLPLFDSDQTIDGKTVPANILNMVSRSLRAMAISVNILETGALTMDSQRKALMTTYVLEFLQYAKELKDHSTSSDYQTTIDKAEVFVKSALKKYQEGQDGYDDLRDAREVLLKIYNENYTTPSGEKIQSLAGIYIGNVFHLLYFPCPIDEHQTPEFLAKHIINKSLPDMYTILEQTVEANLKDTSLMQILQDKKYDASFKMLSWLSGRRKMELTLQSGANAYQGLQLQVFIPSVPISPFELSSHGAASTSIQRIDQFLTRLAHARSEIGAYQNRLESALSYTAQGAESLQDAESRMRDANMAKETADYLKTKLQNDFQLSFLAQKNPSATDLSVLSFPNKK